MQRSSPQAASRTDIAASFSSTGSVLQTVLLLHDLPDGSSHVDWMIDCGLGGDSEEKSLITFRLMADLRSLPSDSPHPAKRTADHRRAYLTLEGPVSGGRGTVRRLASGRASVFMAGDGVPIGLSVIWDDGKPSAPLRVVLEQQERDCWTVRTGGVAHSGGQCGP